MRLPKIRTSLTLIFIIFIAAILRLLTLEKLMVFTPDEEYILYITQTLVKDFHVIWIGVSALGFDFYMGPGLEYFLMPFIFIFRGDPVIWSVITSMFGVITVYLIYWLGNKMFNKKTGIISAFIYSCSALFVYYDQQPYPTGVPLISISILICLYMTKYSKKWLILFAFLYGVVFHIHLSLILVLAVSIYWLVVRKEKLKIKTILFSILIFLVTISPLIVFDFIHNFSNITAPIRVVQAIGKTNTSLNFIDRIVAPLKTASRIVYLDTGKSNTDEILYPCNFLNGNNATGINLFVLGVIIFLIYLFFKKYNYKDESKHLLLVFSLAFLIPYIFLPSIGAVEYYLLGLFPAFVLIIGNSLSKLNKKAVYLILGLFFIYNVITIFKASGDFGITTKKRIISQVIDKVGNDTFELVEIGGPCQGSAGWGYLFSIYGRNPDKNTADKQFSWLVPIGNLEQTKYTVTINENRYHSNIKNFKYSITEGGFTAYIVEN